MCLSLNAACPAIPLICDDVSFSKECLCWAIEREGFELLVMYYEGRASTCSAFSASGLVMGISGSSLHLFRLQLLEKSRLLYL